MFSLHNFDCKKPLFLLTCESVLTTGISVTFVAKQIWKKSKQNNRNRNGNISKEVMVEKVEILTKG